MRNPEKRRVLIVNDDPVQLKYTTSVMEKSGWNAVSSSSAENAFTVLESDGNFDLIISDLHMPNIDGWRFCRLLRSPDFKEQNKTPIIFNLSNFFRN